MPANIIAPCTGDTPKIPVGGSLNVAFCFNFGAVTNIKADIDNTDFGPTVPVNGTGCTSTLVPCSKPAGVHNIAVSIKTGAMAHDTENPKLTVMGPPPPPMPVAQRVAPAPPAALPAPGSGPIQYVLSDNFAANVAYIVLAAHEWTADPVIPPVTVSGVFVRNTGAAPWAGMVTVPNNPNRGYTVRVIEYDANDNEVGKQTVPLL